MNIILLFLRDNMNTIIFVSGIILAVFLSVNASKLSQQKGRIHDALNRKKTKGIINKKTMEMNEYEETESVTPETIRNYETAFNKVCSRYNVYAQFIPLFPLFGILGTVSGLMLQVATEDIEVMFDSLNLALGSTWCGLFFAITLKILVALSSNRIINDVEIILDDYDKKFNNIIAQRNISES